MLTILAALILCCDDLPDDVFDDDESCHPEKVCPECGIDHETESMYDDLDFPHKSYQFGLDEY